MGVISVQQAFAIRSIGFVIAGDIVEGECRIGTVAQHPNGSEFLIKGVEVVDVNRAEDVAYPALVLDSDEVRAASLDRPEAWLGRDIKTYGKEDRHTL